MQPGALLHEGKSKQIYATDAPDRVVVRFTDRATAFNAQKAANVPGKGRLNCAISARLFELAGRAGVAHHMVRQLSETDLLCVKVGIVPVEVVVRSVVAGSLARRYGLKEGERLPQPLVEWFYKSDDLGDPLVGRDAIVALGWAAPWELAYLEHAARAVHAALAEAWASVGVDLVDAKYEFGRHDGRILLADELTPDGARLWDRATGKPLDKDVFRHDLGDLSAAYRTLLDRLAGG